jgi:hypothetical protein
MDKAMYIMHKLNGEFDQEGHALNVQLGDRLTEYAWQAWMKYNGVRDPLDYHPQPARRKTVGHQYRPIIADKLPVEETAMAAAASPPDVDLTDDANDYQLAEYLNNAEPVASPVIHEEATHIALPPIYQRAFAQYYFVPHRENEQALLTRIHDEMRAAIQRVQDLLDDDFDKARDLMKALIRLLYTRRVYFVSAKLL